MGYKFKVLVLLISVLFSFNTIGEVMIDTVNFEVEEGVNLSGVLSVPSDKTKKYPAVLFLEGSGQSPQTERSAQDPFAALIFELSKNNIIGLHYNKRGSGENTSNGFYLSAGLEKHSNDAIAAFNHLKSLPYVDSNKIYILGQSIGGVLATQVALKENIAGLIFYAAPSGSFKELISEQNKLMQKYMGKEQSEIDNYIFNLEKDITAMEEGAYVCTEPNCVVIEGAEAYEGVESVQFFKDLVHNSQITNFEKMSANALLIHGTSDFIVPVKDSELAFEALKKNNSDVTLKVIEGLDHFFADNKSKEDSFRYVLNAQQTRSFQDVNSELISSIVDWLNARAH